MSAALGARGKAVRKLLLSDSEGPAAWGRDGAPSRWTVWINRSIIASILAIGSIAAALAATSTQPQTQPARTMSTFTFDCASPDMLKATHLEAAARQALDSLGDSGTRNWADRAVLADLNDDGSPEVFVPLSCGATCNCTWAVFQQAPPRLIGQMGACVLHIQPGKPWATVLTYSQMSDEDGFLQPYSFEKDSYRGSALSEVAWSAASSKLECAKAERCCTEVGTQTRP